MINTFLRLLQIKTVGAHQWVGPNEYTQFMFYSKIRKLFSKPLISGMTWLINCLLQPSKYATSWCFYVCKIMLWVFQSFVKQLGSLLSNLSSILNKRALRSLVAHLIWPFVRSGKSIITPKIMATLQLSIFNVSVVLIKLLNVLCNVKECKDKPQWIVTFKPKWIKSGQWLMDSSSRQTDGLKWTDRDISRPLALWIQTRRCALSFPYN